MQVNFDNDDQVHALWVLGKAFLERNDGERNDGQSRPAALDQDLDRVRYAVRACERALRSLGWQPQSNGDMVNTASLSTRGIQR